MKLIHCADIHLGSKMESKLPREKAERRKGEVRDAFSRMVAYAVDNRIEHILLAGDIFDSESPFTKDKRFFYSVVRANPAIHFYYLRGNHDIGASYEEHDLDNLFIFGREWTTYTLADGITLAGLELCPENVKSAPSTLHLDPVHVNLVMLHGMVKDGGQGGDINLAKYRDKHIDYLALGHIHSYDAKPLDTRGTYVYAGCPEGRGYDEPGEKGFVIVDITDGIVTHAFHPHAQRTINAYTVDISASDDAYTALSIIRSVVTTAKENLVRVTLTGEISYDNTSLECDLEQYMENDYFHVSVKDRTLPSLDISCEEGDISLRAEFIRTVTANPAYTEEEKREILAVGLKALAGREV